MMFKDITYVFWEFNDEEVKDNVLNAIITESHTLSKRSRKLSAIIYDEKGTVYIEQDNGVDNFVLLPKYVQKQVYKFLKSIKKECNLVKIHNIEDKEYSPIYIK